jgi:hypothetical protein
MKNLFLSICLLMTVGVFAQSPATFKATTFSFGKIPQGKPVTTEFVFTNTSGKPLLVENATAGCGCTTPEYPKQPIAKGKTGSIKVTYNAAATGIFTKQVTVKFAGTQEPVVLNITGEVATDAKAATPAPKKKVEPAAIQQ